MSTRPVVSAEPREVVGKKVSSLRREGILPAVVYGKGLESQPIGKSGTRAWLSRGHLSDRRLTYSNEPSRQIKAGPADC